MKLFIKHATKQGNVYRALKVGFVVGTILGAINHYDMFLTGEYPFYRLIQIALTYFVPFSVSLHGAAMYGRAEELHTDDKIHNA